MALPEVFEGIRRRPAMYLDPATFDTVVAFTLGYDDALSGGFLVGFREWLIVKAGDGNNLAWTGLVRSMCRCNEVSDAEARESLFGLLAEFRAARADREGLKRIYLNYEEWLCRQSWYTPEGQGTRPRRQATTSSSSG